MTWTTRGTGLGLVVIGGEIAMLRARGKGLCVRARSAACMNAG